MKPLLKYAGGKSRELPFILPLLPKSFNTYFEPFLGGGALFFYLEPSKAYISDINPDLIDFYRSVANNPFSLIEEMKSFGEGKEEYYYVRDLFNNKIENNYSRASLFGYLNRTSFSGLMRYNSKGEFNTPFGKYSHKKRKGPWEFITPQHTELLKQVTLETGDFFQSFRLAKKGDFMFLDPPYLNTFEEYTCMGFSLSDHERLATLLHNTRCNFLLIIGEFNELEDLYANFIQGSYNVNCTINARNFSNPLQEKKSKRIIISNYTLTNKKAQFSEYRSNNTQFSA